MRVSLGLKQLCEDAWEDIGIKYHAGKVVNGEVALTRDHGCFVKRDQHNADVVTITFLDM